MLENVLQWVEKNAKDGADLGELRGMIPTAEEMARHPEVKPHFDRAVTSAVQTHDTKFRDEKLPGLIQAEREKIMAELNPKETDDQKLLRETRQEITALKQREAISERKTKLRRRANELKTETIGLPAEFFESFAVFGDDAVPTLDAFFERVSTNFSKTLNSEIETKLAERLGSGTPRAGSTPIGDTPKTIDEAQKLYAENPQAFAAHRKNAVREFVERMKQ